MEAMVVGGGLAGAECAWQLAERGVDVTLIEQRPVTATAAHATGLYAELVCSNSLRGNAATNAVGTLKEELRQVGSLVLECAERTRVPAGGALAVDRTRFSELVTAKLAAHPRVIAVTREVTSIPAERPCVIATGPLTGDALGEDLTRIVGRDHLAYYDAIAPVIEADSIDWTRVFRASRYGKGTDDYVNCPMDEPTYRAFVAAIVESEKVTPRGFEESKCFEGCLPIETIASRGADTLAFGSMKPVGLTDPQTGRRPFAVVQLRQENESATAYNMVGFQTRMTWPEQKRVFRMIPGLESARFERLGTVHRNTFVDAPRVVTGLELDAAPGVYLAGQITGVEGYVESAASGFTVGVMLAAKLHDQPWSPPPATTTLGALWRYVATEREDFQPSNVVWSMVPPLDDGKRRKKRHRREAMSSRALTDLASWWHAAEGDATTPPQVSP